VGKRVLSMHFDARSILGISFIVMALGLASVVVFGQKVSKPREASVVAEQPVAAQPSTTVVAIAVKDIHRGDRITRQSLSWLHLSQPAPADAIAQPADVVGTVALDDFKAGQLIIRSEISRDQNARPGLSALVPDGMRAVALRVNDEIAVGNFLRPDDRVDIELVLPADQLAKIEGQSVATAGRPATKTLLQYVQILSVGEALTVTQDDRAVRMQNLTVAVTPKQALLIGLGKQIGTFYLALRHPSDEKEGNSGWATVDEILGKTASPIPDQAKSAAAAGSTSHVTIILGNKEVRRDVP
jgi:pilus assembly protein CpaB